MAKHWYGSIVYKSTLLTLMELCDFQCDVCHEYEQQIAPAYADQSRSDKIWKTVSVTEQSKSLAHVWCFHVGIRYKRDSLGVDASTFNGHGHGHVTARDATILETMVLIGDC